MYAQTPGVLLRREMIAGSGMYVYKYITIITAPGSMDSMKSITK